MKCTEIMKLSTTPMVSSDSAHDGCSRCSRGGLGAAVTRPVIVLDHQPYGVAKADSLGVDLLFCGHTHRGQVWPLTWVTDRLFEQSHGYRRWTHSHVYVSQGLSLWGPPFRIGSDSEMVVFQVGAK